MRKPKRAVLWFGGVVLAVFLVLQFLPRDRALWNAILESKRVELFSIDPDSQFGSPDESVPAPPKLDHWTILGQTILDTNEKMTLVNALERSANTGGWGCIGVVVHCFNPRHALRYTQAGVTYNVIVCFECKKIFVTADGKDKKQLLIEGDESALFNTILQKHNIPLAPPPAARRNWGRASPPPPEPMSTVEDARSSLPSPDSLPLPLHK